MSILWGVVSIWVLANVAFGIYVVCLYFWTESGRGTRRSSAGRTEGRAGPAEPGRETVAR